VGLGLYPEACLIGAGCTPRHFFAAPPEGLWIPQTLLLLGGSGAGTAGRRYADLAAALQADSGTPAASLLVVGGLGKTLALLQMLWGLVQTHAEAADLGVGYPAYVPCWLPTDSPADPERPFWSRLQSATGGDPEAAHDVPEVTHLQSLLAHAPPILFFVDLPAAMATEQKTKLILEAAEAVGRYPARGHRLVIASRSTPILARDTVYQAVHAALPRLRCLAVEAAPPAEARQIWEARGYTGNKLEALIAHLEMRWQEITPFVPDAWRVLEHEGRIRILACDPQRAGTNTRGDSGGHPVTPSPEQFFGALPDAAQHAYYIPTQVRACDPRTGQPQSEPQPLEQILQSALLEDPAHPPHMVLLGDAGSGKTTELLRLAYRFWRDPWQAPAAGASQALTPILVTSEAITGAADAGHEHESFRNILLNSLPSRKQFLRARLPNEAAVQEELWLELQSQEPFLFLVDGWDEIRARYREFWPDQAAHLLAASLEQALAGFVASPVVVASRKPPPGIEQENILLRPPFATYAVYELLPLAPAGGLQYLCRIMDPAWLPGQPVPPGAQPIIERVRPTFLTNPILVYLLSTLVGADLDTDLQCLGYAPGTPLNLGLIYRLAIDRWLRQEFNEVGYYDVRAQRGETQLPERLPTSQPARSGLSREFYERVLEEYAYLHSIGSPLAVPPAVEALGLLEQALYILFQRHFQAMGLALPARTWWPLRYEDARLPQGFFWNGASWEIEPTGLRELAAQLARSTLLHIRGPGTRAMVEDHMMLSPKPREPELALDLEAYWVASRLIGTGKVLAGADVGRLPASVQQLQADLLTGRAGMPTTRPQLYQFPHASFLEFFAASASLERHCADIENTAPSGQVARVQQLGQEILDQLGRFALTFGVVALALAEKYRLAPVAVYWLQFYGAAVTHWRASEQAAHPVCERLLQTSACNTELRARLEHQVGGNCSIQRGRRLPVPALLIAAYPGLRQLGDSEAAAKAPRLLGQAMHQQGRQGAIADRLEQEVRTLPPGVSTVSARLRVGLLFRQQGWYRRAKDLLRRSLAKGERLGTRPTKHAETRLAIGDLLVAERRCPEPLMQYTQALADLKAYRERVLVETGLDNYDIRFNLGSAHLGLGGFYRANRDAVSLALAATRAEMAIHKLGGDHVLGHWAKALNLLGEIRHAQGFLVGSAECYEEALEKAQACGDTVTTLLILANQWHLAWAGRSPGRLGLTTARLFQHSVRHMPRIAWLRRIGWPGKK